MEKVLAILKDELGELYEEFIEIMRKDNVIITGSFILNVLTDRNYKNSDIDIYTQRSDIQDDIKSIYQSYHKSAGAKTTYTDLYYYLTLCDIKIEKLKIYDIVRKYPHIKLAIWEYVKIYKPTYERFYTKTGGIYSSSPEYYIKCFTQYNNLLELMNNNNDDAPLFCLIHTYTSQYILKIEDGDIINLNETNSIQYLSNIELLIYHHYWPYINRTTEKYENAIRVKDYQHRLLSNKCVLQVIQTSCLHTTINEFDFDQCKNYLSRDIDGTFHLHIENISNNIIVDRVKNNNYLKRIKKYESRGFNIIYQGEDEDIIRQMVNDEIDINDIPKNLPKKYINDINELLNKNHRTSIQIPTKIPLLHIPNIEFNTERVPLDIIKFIIVPENNNRSYNTQASTESIISKCLYHGIQFDNRLRIEDDSNYERDHDYYYNHDFHQKYTSFFTLHEKHIELPYQKLPFL